MYVIMFDVIDCWILVVLQEEGRISNFDLVECILFLLFVCLCCMCLFEEQGVIEYYCVCLSCEKFGFEFEVFVQVLMCNEEN